MLPFETYQRFCTDGVLTTGQASLTLMPSVPGYQYALVGYSIICLVAAAQETFLGDANEQALIIPSTMTTGEKFQHNFQEGLKLTASSALVLTPAGAGPRMHVVAEGYILKHKDAINTTA